MNIYFFLIAALLFGINLLITMITIIKIGGAYIDDFIDSNAYLFRALLIWAVITLMNVVLSIALSVFNHTGLALLIQVGILVVGVLFVIIFDKIGYKRNVKRYLQIKF